MARRRRVGRKRKAVARLGRRLVKTARRSGYKVPRTLRRGARLFTAGRLLYKAYHGISDDNVGSSHRESLKSIKISLRKPKKLYKATGTYSFYSQFGGPVLTNPEGQQGVAWLGSWCTYDQIAVSNAAPNELYQFKDCAFDLNPYNVWTNTATYGAGSNALKVSDRVHWKHSIGDIQICNLSNVACDATVYFFLNKVTTANAIHANMSTIFNSEGLNAVTSVQRPSVAGTATLGFPLLNQYGISPVMSPQFRKSYKLLKKCTFGLGSGENKLLNVKFDINKTFDKQFFNVMQNTDSYIANHTISAVLIWRPQVVHQTSGVGAGDYITTGQCELGVVEHFKHVFTSLSPNRYDTGMAYPDVITGGAKASEGLVNVIDAVATVLGA